MEITYQCIVCNGTVSTDADVPFTCTCPHPTAPPLQSATQLAGNGAGHDKPQPPIRIKD